MPNFSLYELSIMANAVEHQRKLAMDDYVQRCNALDRISSKIRAQIDSLRGEKSEFLRERGYYDDILEDIEE